MKASCLIAVILAAAASLGGDRKPCPYDKFQSVWNGEIRTINGRNWYVLKCPAGHETLAESPR